MLCCEKCPKVAHWKCLKLPSKPTGDWFCPACTDQKAEKLVQISTEKPTVKKSPTKTKKDESDREWDDWCFICDDGGNMLCCE